MAPSGDVVNRPGKQPPEVILQTDQFAAIYKPPFWKCELPPEPGSEAAKEQARRAEEAKKAGRRVPQDCQDTILTWIRAQIPDIEEALFD